MDAIFECASESGMLIDTGIIKESVFFYLAYGNTIDMTTPVI